MKALTAERNSHAKEMGRSKRKTFRPVTKKLCVTHAMARESVSVNEGSKVMVSNRAQVR